MEMCAAGNKFHKNTSSYVELRNKIFFWVEIKYIPKSQAFLRPLLLQLVLEANQNKNSCLVSNFLNKLKFPALFSLRNWWEKRAGDFNLSKKLLNKAVILILICL